MTRIIQPEESSLPVQCEREPTGLGLVVVYDDHTYALPSTRIIQPEESSLPVQCKSDPTGLGGVVVYDDHTYALPSQ